MIEQCPDCKLTLTDAGECPRCQYMRPHLDENTRTLGAEKVAELRAELGKKTDANNRLAPPTGDDT